MKIALGVISAALLSLTPASAETKFSERLSRVESHLGDAGAHFSVTDSKGDLQGLAKFIDRLIDSIPNEDIPDSFKIEQIIGDLGLYSLEARGSSSHQIGSYWHNRSFILTDGKHEGLLSLLGDQSKAPTSSNFAPAGADLVLESSLNLREVERTAKKLSKIFGKEAEEDVTQGFQEEIKELGLNLADLFADFTIRGTVVLWLDEEKTFEPQPGMKLPVPHLAAKIDNAGVLWKLLEKGIRAESEITEKDGEIIVSPKNAPQPTPFGEVHPKLIWSPKDNALYLSLTDADLTACRGQGEKILSSPSYQKATTSFPKELSSLIYVSSDVFRLIETLAEKFSPMAPPESQGLIKELMPYVKKLGTEGGYAAAVSIQKDGFLTVGNFPFPVKGDYALMGPIGVSTLAAFFGISSADVMEMRESEPLEAIEIVDPQQEKE